MDGQPMNLKQEFENLKQMEFPFGTGNYEKSSKISLCGKFITDRLAHFYIVGKDYKDLEAAYSDS